MAQTKTIIDRRLVGTWKSDRRKTFLGHVFPPTSTLQGQRKFKALFGKMQVKWGYRKCDTELDGTRWEYRYEVLGTDLESVAVRLSRVKPAGDDYPSLFPKVMLLHIHFEENYYWITPPLAPRFQEYFRKLK